MSPATSLPSDRSFGLLMAAMAAVGAGYLFWTDASRVGLMGCLALAAGLALTALGRPALLHPLNRLWMRMGELMSRIVNPLVLGVIFFLMLTPLAWLMRLAGRDALNLRRRRHNPSYWVDRESAGPAPDSFKNQF